MTGLGYKRADLQAHAQAKLDDALLLLGNGRYSNAYYLAGYAVEIALKACIAAQFAADVIPDKGFVNSIYQHSLKNLVGAAGLSAEHRDEQDRDSNFAANWALVAQWSPDNRYDSTDAMTAQAMITAIADPKSGVLKWIKAYW
jgi:putative lipase involved disintegration of autophagic bodies